MKDPTILKVALNLRGSSVSSAIRVVNVERSRLCYLEHLIVLKRFSFLRSSGDSQIGESCQND